MGIHLGVAAIAGAVSAVVLAAGGTSSAAAATTPAPVPLNPATLAQGPAAGGSYLAGRVLHTGTGSSIYLPASWESSTTSLKLLGDSPDGWVVLRDQSGSTMDLDRVYLVNPGSQKLIVRRDMTYWLPNWFLSSDGRRIVWVAEGVLSSGTDRVQVMDLSGRTVGDKWTGPVDYLGSTRYNVWLEPQPQAGRTGVKKWNLSNGRFRKVTGLDGEVADPTKDKLFVNQSGIGLTTLQPPGALSWSRTGSWSPAVVSPDGQYVAGVTGNQQAGVYGTSDNVVIRRMSDGAVVQTFRYPANAFYPWGTGEIWWESNTSVLFDAMGDNATTVHSYLVRCTLSGACNRAAATLSAPASDLHDPDFSHHISVDWHNDRNDQPNG